MSQYDGDDDYDDNNQDPSKLVKDLRKQLKALTTRAEAAEAEAAKNVKVVRARTVADVLKDKGVNPALSRFVLQDLEDPTPEAVSTWLTENGELFGVKPPAVDPAQTLGLPAGTELPPDLKAAYEKFIGGQSVTTHSDPTDAVAAKLADPNLSRDDLLGLLTSSGN